MIAAIIQARMGSTRLPGKVLLRLKGVPVLQHVISRVRCSRYIQGIVVATTADPADRAIVQLSERLGVVPFVGSADDVLDRFYGAAKAIGADVITRITADDPFKDPEIIDLVIRTFLDAACDYASNTLEPTYPEGLDVEVLSFSALERAWREATLPSEREHVTPYIWKHPERFKLVSVKHGVDLSHLRWTLDHPEDYEFARAVYERLWDGQVFCMRDVLALLDREPALARINERYERNEGYLSSLRKEALERVHDEDAEAAVDNGFERTPR